jgi:hypothetical protein
MVVCQTAIFNCQPTAGSLNEKKLSVGKPFLFDSLLAGKIN